jgi:plastocyanin
MGATRRYLLSVVAASVPLAGCSGSTGGGNETSTPTASSGTTVELVDRTFQPRTVTVSTGTEVTWTNEDSAPHTVTAAQFHDAAASWSFDERLAADERVAHTFDAAGVYEYVCTVHGESSMCGAVLVGDASLDDPLPCAGGGGSGGYY